MAKKMYYSEEEAAKKLGVSVGDLAKFVRDDKLRVFQDGPRKMYKVDEVDAIAPPSAGGDEVVLSPADSTADKVKIEDEPAPAGPTKEDTVITAEGISIFDDEDLEIESADPMAKTQIAPSLEEQAAGEGVGSGSGLLDLTRESDDTSLGAEVLDHIGGDSGIGSSLVGETAAVEAVPEQAPAVAMAPVIQETPDPLSGLFSGLIVGSAVIGLVIAMVSMGVLSAEVPSYIEGFKQHALLLVIVLLVVAGAFGAGGYFLTQSAAARIAELNKTTVG